MSRLSISTFFVNKTVRSFHTQIKIIFLISLLGICQGLSAQEEGNIVENVAHLKSNSFDQKDSWLTMNVKPRNRKDLIKEPSKHSWLTYYKSNLSIKTNVVFLLPISNGRFNIEGKKGTKTGFSSLKSKKFPFNEKRKRTSRKTWVYVTSAVIAFSGISLLRSN